MNVDGVRHGGQSAQPRATDDVIQPQKAGDENGLRLAVQRRGRVDLLDAPVVHHRHTVGDGESLLLIVRDVDRGQPHIFDDAPQIQRQPFAQGGIQ